MEARAVSVEKQEIYGANPGNAKHATRADSPAEETTDSAQPAAAQEPAFVFEKSAAREEGKSGTLDGLYQKMESIKRTKKRMSKPQSNLADKARRLRMSQTSLDARMALSEINAALVSLKGYTGEQRKEIEGEIRQMEKLARQAQRKVKKLGNEEALKDAAQRAQRHKQHEKAKEIQQELLQRKRRRKARETAEYAEHMRKAGRKTPYEEWKEEQAAQAEAAAPVEAAPEIAPDVAPVGVDAAAVQAADIAMSGGIDIMV